MGIIKNPQDIFSEITEDFKKAFGTDLVGMLLYGSATGDEYVPGKSDINILVILRDMGFTSLERGIPAVGRWRKRMVTVVFMTRDYIDSSIDAYPIEFLNMKLNHRLLFGADVFEGLTFPPRDLRLQLERELKGKILHLQQGFLDSEGKDKGIRQLIRVSLGAFLPLFRALLFLRGYEIPTGRRDVIKALSLAYNIKPDVYLHCVDVREGKDKYSSGEIKELFKSYHEEIAKLSSCIDCLEV